jgi:hypothetical protein
VQVTRLKLAAQQKTDTRGTDIPEKPPNTTDHKKHAAMTENKEPANSRKNQSQTAAIAKHVRLTYTKKQYT